MGRFVQERLSDILACLIDMIFAPLFFQQEYRLGVRTQDNEIRCVSSPMIFINTPTSFNLFQSNHSM